MHTIAVVWTQAELAVPSGASALHIHPIASTQKALVGDWFEIL